MSFVLDRSATVMCAHGGQGQATAPFARVKLSGQPVVVQPAPHVISGCPFNVAGAPVPCVTAQWIVAAIRVKAGGMPVLLQSSQAICAPNGTPVTIVPSQFRVRAT